MMWWGSEEKTPPSRRMHRGPGKAEPAACCCSPTPVLTPQQGRMFLFHLPVPAKRLFVSLQK